MPYIQAGHGPVVVVGSLNFDHVITVERLPQPGETISGDGYIAVPGERASTRP